MKNQWGWGGFTTHDLHRRQLAARTVALIYNWWSLGAGLGPFVRLASPHARRETITSRLWLMSTVGRSTEHAGQTTMARGQPLTLTGLHAEFGKARDALMRVSAWLQGWVVRAAEQLRTQPPSGLSSAIISNALSQASGHRRRIGSWKIMRVEWGNYGF